MEVFIACFGKRQEIPSQPFACLDSNQQDLKEPNSSSAEHNGCEISTEALWYSRRYRQWNGIPTCESLFVGIYYAG